MRFFHKPADDESQLIGRAMAALAAGSVAIGLNMGALAAADFIPLATAHGGLLRLLNMTTGNALRLPAGVWFQSGFHVLVGLAMALFYALALAPILPGPAWARGLLYGAIVWVVNAAIVLPLTGEGFAGGNHLTPAGMIWFAAAHTLFFVVQAVLYERLRPKSADLAGA